MTQHTPNKRIGTTIKSQRGNLDTFFSVDTSLGNWFSAISSILLYSVMFGIAS
jgi:hypothetical protein